MSAELIGLDPSRWCKYEVGLWTCKVLQQHYEMQRIWCLNNIICVNIFHNTNSKMNDFNLLFSSLFHSVVLLISKFFYTFHENFVPKHLPWNILCSTLVRIIHLSPSTQKQFCIFCYYIPWLILSSRRVSKIYPY